MTDTVFVRGTGGAIFEIDVPVLPHAVERWEQALNKGDLVIVDASTVEKVDTPGGGYQWRHKNTDEPDVEIVALRDVADGLGIKVDLRWGVQRLKAEIDSVTVDTGS